MEFAEKNGTVWITIIGDGRKEDVPELASYAKAAMGRGLRAFAVDLSECTGLEPEFTGTLAGLALRLDELGSGSVRLFHLDPAMESGLRDLGLDRLFE